ncbi:MAG: helix-turn-helix domain-containing protein [Acutalibacteraceae bacterium]|jgi:transcriptional regulator with XRE-family HTH domain
MFKNRTLSGKNNVCGDRVRRLRQAQAPRMSQRALAEKLQLLGLDVDKNAVQRIESGQRFVTDIELTALRRVFDVTYEDLLG